MEDLNQIKEKHTDNLEESFSFSRWINRILIGFGIVLAGLALILIIDIIRTPADTVYVGTLQDGAFEWAYTKGKKEYKPLSYTWDGNPEHMDIYIPDTYNGKTITEIGGGMEPREKREFSVKIPNEYISELASEVDCLQREPVNAVYADDYTTYDMVVHVGSKAESIVIERNEYYGIDEESNRILFVIRIKVDIDSDNPYYYSRNGEYDCRVK